MKRVAILTLAVFPAIAPAQRYRDRDWNVEDKETIRRSFDVSSGSGAVRLLVDNVSGFIHVTGTSGKEIQVSVEKRILAHSGEAVAEAKRDVKLDLSQQGNFVRLYVDGPFRSGNGVNYRGDQYYGYRVIYDFEIQVPAATELVLKTVNNGEIAVKRTSGTYEINGLNGGIEMEEISGSGSVRTLNGPLKVAFSKNPVKDSEFHTLNGKVDVYFQPGINADMSFSTLNGGIYTDFELVSLPERISAGDTSSGRFVYRSTGRSIRGRAGKGGPALKFQTLNGAIRLHSKGL